MFGVSFACATGFSLGAASAQITDDERAQTHFSSGRLYFEEGAYDRALQEFERAYELSHRTALLLNIANAAERLGRYDRAIEALTGYLTTVAVEDPERARLERRISNLERLRHERDDAGTTTAAPPVVSPSPPPVPLTTAPPVVSPSPPPLPVTTAPPDVGSVQTTAAVGAVPDQPPPAAGGAPAPSSAPVADPPPQQDASGSHGWPGSAYALVGIGGAGLVTFGVAGGLALADRNALESGCGSTRSCSAEDVAPADRRALIADIGLGLGVSGALAGILIASASGNDDAPPRVALIPHPLVSGVAVTAIGRFR